MVRVLRSNPVWPHTITEIISLITLDSTLVWQVSVIGESIDTRGTGYPLKSLHRKNVISVLALKAPPIICSRRQLKFLPLFQKKKQQQKQIMHDIS